MKSLELYSATREVSFELKTFAGGEESVRIDRGDIPEDLWLTAHVRSSTDLMRMFMLTDAARRLGAKRIHLIMPYLPYARQDRVCTRGESLSVAVIAKMINAQGYDTVEVWDCHSDVGLALIDRVVHKTPDLWVRRCYSLQVPPVLVAPDAGAIKKVHSMAEHLRLRYVRADKTRDPISGHITGTKVYSNHIGKQNFLIADDICDGGRTFVALAKELRPLTDGEIHLYITHGIFSYGTAVFDGVIDRVFVANSFVDTLPAHFTKV